MKLLEKCMERNSSHQINNHIEYEWNRITDKCHQNLPFFFILSVCLCRLCCCVYTDEQSGRFPRCNRPKTFHSTDDFLFQITKPIPTKIMTWHLSWSDSMKKTASKQPTNKLYKRENPPQQHKQKQQPTNEKE